MTAGIVCISCAGTQTSHVSASDDKSEDSETAEQTSSTTIPPDCATMLPNTAKVGLLITVLVNEPTHASEMVAAGTVNGFGMVGAQRSDVDEAIAEVTADAPLPPIVAVDEEGGEVQRLKWSAGVIPSAAEMAEGTPEEAASVFSDHAAAMAEMGVNINYAPVADLDGGAGMDTRTYGDDPARVSEFVSAIMEAQEAQAVTPVVKHWPGLRTATEDPHDGLTTLAPIDQLRQTDLIPFQAAIDAGATAMMVTHAVVPGLTGEDEPASLSRAAITDELRGRQGFDGLIITDALGMDAITDTTSQAQAAVRAVAAGADIVLVTGSDDADEAHELLEEALESGELDTAQVEDSIRRVLGLKGIEGECFDLVSTFAAASRAPESGVTTTEGFDGDSGVTTTTS